MRKSFSAQFVGVCSITLCTLIFNTSLWSQCPSGTLAGQVYIDYNNNGSMQTNEVGKAGIAVQVYDAFDDLAGQALTDNAGQYSISGLKDGDPYRLEYNFSGDYIAADIGSGNGGNIQFHTAPFCQSMLGLRDEALTCSPETEVFLSCFVNGLGDNSPNQETIIGLKNGFDETAPVSVYATQGETGAVWGIVYKETTQEIFSSAFVKQHASLGPNGIGAIYRTDITGGSTSLFADLQSLGVNVGTVANTDSDDCSYGDFVGKQGLGGLTMNDDGSYLFVTNLYNNTVVRVSALNPSATTTTSFQVPDPGCSDGDYRIFGVKYHGGSVYVTVTCTAETSLDESDTSMHVYEMNAVTGSFSLVFSSEYLSGYWNDKNDSYKRSMQWLTDIDFVGNGNAVLALTDRVGHIYCNNAASRSDDQFGDLLLITNNNGVWTLEDNGSLAGLTGTGIGNGEGPGGGEFFGDDYFPGNPADHPEVALGSVHIIPGSNEVIAAVFDPAHSAYSGGLHRYSTQNGQKLGTRELYNQNIANYFGKATGFGDIHGGCSPASAQVGNYVWIDDDGDGIQSAGEEVLANSRIDLYDSQCNIIGTTQTDAGGNYHFSGLTRGVQYFLSFDPSAFDAEIEAYNINNFYHIPTVTHTNVNLNSNLLFGSTCPTDDGHPVISVQPLGANDLNFDIGLIPSLEFDLAAMKVNKSAKNHTYGDIIEFEIQVYNQGSVAATSFEIVDYLSPAYSFDENINPGWNLEGNKAKKFINTILLPGQAHSESIKLQLKGYTDLAQLVNYAEISATMDINGNSNSDIDSTTDDDNTNDAGGEVDSSNDDLISDDGTIDEDDHDPAMVYIFDLALLMKNRNDRAYDGGEKVFFDITVFNQGNTDATGFEIVDNFPKGLIFNSADNKDWTLIGSQMLSYSYNQNLAVGEKVTIPVCFTLEETSREKKLYNYAEIANASSANAAITDDFDSVADMNMSNDNGGVPDSVSDNMIDDHGVKDEDDHDPATVRVRIVDVALIKKVVQTSYDLGDNVTFSLEIHNQGSTSIGQVQLVDYLPKDMTLADNSWTLDASGTMASKDIKFVTPLAPGKMFEDHITMSINSSADRGAFLNVAEISRVYDVDNFDVGSADIDSSPDAVMGNDAGGQAVTILDDYLLGNGTDDEDDSDPAMVYVPTIGLTESCRCLNNARATARGQFAEEIQITSASGETWYIDSEFEFYAIQSVPGNEISYPTGPLGKRFKEIPIGDGTSYYILKGKSIDGNPYTLRATNGWGVFLSIDGGDCDYCAPLVISDGIGAVCANTTHTYSVDTSDPKYDDCVGFSWFLSGGVDVGTIVNMPGTNVTGSGTGMTGSGTGPGNSVTIEWGTAPGPHDLVLYPHCPNDCVAPVALSVNVGMDDSEMACQHEINMSLNGGCESVLTPQDILTSEILPGVAYQLILTDAYGKVIQGNLVEEEHLWTRLMAKVMNPCSGNSCWAFINVEDKLPPKIQCDDIEVKCYQVHNYEPLVLDNCSTATFELLNETVTPLPCSAPYLKEVYRTYRATDGYGNVSQACMQKIQVLPLDLEAIEIPGDFTTLIGNALSCKDLELDEEGHPAVSVTGVPMIGGQDLYPVTDLYCNVGVDYRDVVVVDFGCSKKIMRTWTIYEGCREPLRRVQAIEISDDNAPVIECPGNLTVNTDGSPGCDTEYVLPMIGIVDDCTTEDFKLDIKYPGGFLSDVTEETTVILSSANDTEITYYVYDQCGNLAECSYNVMVLDNITPTAICDKNSVVSLRLDGTAKAFSQTFDNGSYDDCDLFNTLVRRMDSPCDCDRPKFDDMKFLGERNGRYYYLSSFERPCFKAFSYATAYGGTLLTLESEAEHDWVYEQVEDYLPGERYYIGLKDKTGNGDFTWDNHASPAFDVWADGSPSGDGDCVVVNADGEWAVVGDVNARFVMEVANPCSFSEEVSFCCEDVGQESMVVLRAIDYFGGYNDCMVNIEVQDKVPPILRCPDNEVLDCSDEVDITNLSSFGDAVASDVCLVDITPTVIDERTTCGTGNLIRRFTATDASGSSTCDQIIEFVNNAPFDFNSIVPPSDFETDLGCNFGLLDPENLPEEYAYPSYTFDACDSVDATHEDQVFSFAGVGSTACLKILRKWTVIDWCQQDENGISKTVSFDQTIKVINTSGPEILEDANLPLNGCADITVKTLDCESAQVTFSVEAQDDCTPDAQLSNCIRIDLDEDDIEICSVSNVINFDRNLPVGEHFALISYSDMCGNTTTCSKTITVRNEKPPIAYCKSGISVALEPMDLTGDGIPDDEMACIFPHMLDLGSSHPCDSNFGISFCNNDPTNKIAFRCTDIGIHIVTLCVIDEFGNSASCETTVEVQDNNDDNFCPEFDLAILKEISNAKSIYNPGDTVDFRITVYNQGNIEAINTVLTDYIPDGLIYDPTLNTGWTGPDVNGDILFASIPSILANPFDEAGIHNYEIVTLSLVIDPNTMEVCLENGIEISASGNPDFAEYSDIDSHADNIDGNDFVKDNVLTEDGYNNQDEDEDDHDIAKVNVFQLYDLALTKTITSGFVGPYNQGDDIQYTITIENQGSLDATTIDVRDNIPAGLVLNDSDWTLVNGNAELTNSIPFVGVGTSQSVTIDFTIASDFMGAEILNDAEIIDRDNSDIPDVDSDTSTGKDVDEDNDGDGDDDDEDWVRITMEQDFDLALQKVIKAGEPTMYNTGDDVTFTIRVINQGTLDATDVAVTDYVRSNFLYTQAGTNQANGWSAGPNPTNIIGNIPAGGTATVEIVLRIDPNYTGTSLVNDAEITAGNNALGLPDEDSSPNDNSNTDSEFDTDNDIADESTNGVDNINDNDDYDPARVDVSCVLEPICSVISALTVQLDANGMATITPGQLDNGSSARCDGLGYSISLSQSAFTCTNKNSTVSVLATVTDDRGNVSADPNCRTTVTVEDNMKPTISCVGILTDLDTNGQPIIDLNDVVTASDDNCGIVSTVLSPPVNVDKCTDNMASVTVTDACGNSETCNFIVSIRDQAPEARCVPDFDLVLSAAGTASLSANDIDNGSDDDCGSVVLAINEMNFDCNDVGPKVIMLSVFDNNVIPLTDQCTTTVTIVDNTPPVADCQNISVAVNNNGVVVISPNQINDNSTDACGLRVNPFSLSERSFNCDNVGQTNTTVLTVTDVNGNTDTCSATVTVTDDTDPVINCRIRRGAILDANGQFSIDPSYIVLSSSDNCESVNLAIDKNTFNCTEAGTTVVVTATATDGSNNTAECQTEINVQDREAPVCTLLAGQIFDVIGDPPSITVTAAEMLATYTDNCNTTAATATINPATFDCSDLGTRTVTVNVTDDSGNSSNCSTEITIRDVSQPTCEVKPDVTLYLEANGSVAVTVADINISSTAGCDSNASLVVTPSLLACNTVPLSPITVTLLVTASNGNTAECQSSVTVLDTLSPDVNCVSTLELFLDANGSAAVTVTEIVSSSVDNCPGETIALSPTTFDCADKGNTNIVTATVTDASGNTSTCATSITLEDEIDPVCTLQTGLSFELIGTPPSVTISASDVLATYTDNCGTTAANMTIAPAVFDCSDVGTQDVVVTVTDNCGNTSNCSTSVNIADTSLPTCLSKDITVELDDTGSYALSAAEVDDGSNAGCGTNVILTVSPNDFNCNSIGANTVTLTVTTTGGNSASCSSTVTVEDNIDPVLTCPDDMNVACGDPQLLDLNNFGFATATDNCPNSLGTISVNPVSAVNSCGIGDITRIFAVQSQGNNFVCNQVLSIIQAPAFSASNIICPSPNATIDGCVDLGNIVAGSPIVDVSGISCVDISIDSTLVDLTPQTSGTCVDTFLKTWTILDNCTNVEFTCTQTIILNDADGPVINCRDTIIFLPVGFTTCSLFVDLPVGIIDSCSMNPTGTNNSPFADDNSIANASGTYPGGTTSVTIEAMDNCGNESECTYNVTLIDSSANISDCKKIIESLQPPNPGAGFPFPYGIVDTSQACVTIESNCPGTQFNLSFDRDDQSVVTIFVDCDDAANPGGIVPGGYTVYMWAGGVLLDSCSNFLQVLDGAGHCVQPVIGNILGSIETEDHEMIPEVMVNLEGSNMTGYMTDDKGEYAFMNVDYGNSYMIVPEKDKDYLNGVSTLDLIQMQRHILGLESLDSPYKIIAADINRSDSVNGLDLVELRKLILGLYTELPANTSWRMVDAGHEFVDPRNPFYGEIPETYIIDYLNSSMEVDFIGVKIGDVDQTAIVNATGGKLARRAKEIVMLQVQDLAFAEGDIVDIPIAIRGLNEVDGFQYTLEVDNSIAQILGVNPGLDNFTESNMNLTQLETGLMNISWNKTGAIDYDESTELFILSVKLKENAKASDFIAIAEEGLMPEAYANRVHHNLGFDFYELGEQDNVELFQNSPNPWSIATEIAYYMPAAESVTFKVFDINGKLIRQTKLDAKQGNNKIIMDKTDLPSGGIYYYELHTDEVRLTHKMILIK